MVELTGHVGSADPAGPTGPTDGPIYPVDTGWIGPSYHSTGSTGSLDSRILVDSGSRLIGSFGVTGCLGSIDSVGSVGSVGLVGSAKDTKLTLKKPILMRATGFDSMKGIAVEQTSSARTKLKSQVTMVGTMMRRRMMITSPSLTTSFHNRLNLTQTMMKHRCEWDRFQGTFCCNRFVGHE